MKMKSLSAALLAAGVTAVGTAGAFSLTPGWLKHDLAEYVERLEREIAMIQKMQFPGYFLIVWDFIRYARSINIPVGPGRGSAAGASNGLAGARPG